MPGNAQGNVEITLGKPASGDTATGSFGDITYTSVTTSPYIYTITELGYDANGVTISKAKYQVSVTVTDPNHDGQLVVKSTMTRLTDDKGGEVSGDAATVADNTAAFTNTYKAAETTATLNVEKGRHRCGRSRGLRVRARLCREQQGPGGWRERPDGQHRHGCRCRPDTCRRRRAGCRDHELRRADLLEGRRLHLRHHRDDRRLRQRLVV